MSKTVVDLSDIAQRGVAKSGSLHPEKDIKVTITPHLTAFGDPLLLNLRSNSCSRTRQIQLGDHGPSKICFGGNYGETESVFYLYDNGIRFDMASYHELFGVFQRLHHAQTCPAAASAWLS